VPRPRPNMRSNEASWGPRGLVAHTFFFCSYRGCAVRGNAVRRVELLKPSDDCVTRPGGPHCPLLQPPAFGFPHGPVRSTAPAGRKAVESRCRHRHWPCSSIAVHAVRGSRIDARQRPCLASPRSTVRHACSSDRPFQKLTCKQGDCNHLRRHLVLCIRCRDPA